AYLCPPCLLDALPISPKTDHELRAGVGLGFDVVVRRLFPELGVDDRTRVRLVFRERFLADGTDARLFPGAREALEALARDGMTRSEEHTSELQSRENL